MIKIKNQAVIRRLAFRELKSNCKMNLVLMFAIVLTCVLFTALISVGGSLINGTQQETMRQVGGDRMAGLKCVLPEDYEKVKADSETRDVVYRIVVGVVADENLKNISAEVNCAGNEDAAKALFCFPETGTLPKGQDEIAMSSIVMDELKIPYKLGTSVPLKINIDGEILEHTFTLCGWWKGEKVAMAQECWVSRSFADEAAPAPSESFYERDDPGYAGYWMVDFNYANSWNIESRTNELIRRLYGNNENVPDAGVNWAYLTSSVDISSLIGGIALLLLVFAAGYLIIYNIFHINIAANIRNYGLLKTIGMTSKQIRRMVMMQALFYSVASIPPGLFLGLFLGNMLKRSIMGTLVIRSASSYTVSGEMLMLICLVSGIFTFFTVMMSCLKPCKTAGRVSPIEAFRYNEINLPVRKKNKKTCRISPFSIARSNMARARKKTLVVVLSLTLSMVIINTFFSVLKGIDENKYISNRIVGDILIRCNENLNDYDEMTKGITPEIIKEVEQIEGAEVHPIYYDSGIVQPKDAPLQRLKLLREKYRESKEQSAELETAPDSGFTAQIYGIDETTEAFLEPDEGSIDSELFQTGHYAVVHTYLWQADGDKDVELYHPGDRIAVESAEGEQREYEVMAICAIPYPLSTKMYSIFEAQIILPSNEYLSYISNPGSPSMMINAPENSESIKAQCRAYCNREDSQLVYSDKQTYLDEYQGLIRMIQLVGGALSGILALIGILNFVDATVTGILSRKREMAMMNAVGMTDRQIQRMLIWEGTHYTLLAVVSAGIVSSLISFAFLNNIGKELFFFSYHFTLMPIAVCTPILLLLSGVIPVMSYKIFFRTSVVDRLREI